MELEEAWGIFTPLTHAYSSLLAEWAVIPLGTTCLLSLKQKLEVEAYC